MTIRNRDILLYAGGAAIQKYGTLSRRTTIADRRGEAIQETFTRTGTAYYIDRDGTLRIALANTPRVQWYDLDGDGILETPCVLNELARTNTLERSEEFDNAAWTKTNGSIGATNITAPDGVASADRLDASGAGDIEHYVRQSEATVVADKNTFSVFVKKETGADYVWLRVWDGGADGFQAFFNVKTGVVGTTAALGSGTLTRAYISKPLKSNYYRCTVVGIINSGGFNADCDIGLATADNDTSFTQSGETINLWGAQYEEDAEFSSSYIKTVAAAATRNAEALFFDYLAPRAATTFYVRAVELGPNVIGSNSETLMRVGGSGGGDNPRVRLLDTEGTPPGLLWAHSLDGVTIPQVNVAATGLVVSKELEALCILNADGSVQLDISVDGGTPTTGSDALTADMSSGLYADTRLYIDGWAAINAVIVVRGVGRTFREFRELL